MISAADNVRCPDRNTWGHGHWALCHVWVCCNKKTAGDHYVGKPSATGQPTRPTQPFILPRSINE